MSPRIGWILVGVFAACSIGLALSAVYPFDTAAPHAAKPAAERFTIGDAAGYRAAGRIAVDGETTLAFEGVVTPDGRWCQRVEEDGVTTEGYRPAPDGPVFERRVLASQTDAEHQREQLERDDTRELLRYEGTADGVTLVVRRHGPTPEDPVTGTATVFVRSLDLARYESGGNASGPVAEYEPQSGWYGESESYRLTSASGEVRADPDTHAVESANVSWDLTVPAGSYAEYLLASLTSDVPRTYVISFKLDPGDHDLCQPAWVNDAEVE